MEEGSKTKVIEIIKRWSPAALFLAIPLLIYVFLRDGIVMLSFIGVAGFLLSLLEERWHKHGGALALAIVLVVVSHSNFIGSDGLHPKCRKAMGFLISNEKKAEDTDGDGFSLHCEDMGNGDDGDATRIPNIGDLSALPPSFAEQFNDSKCVFVDGDEPVFKFYHAGLAAKSIEKYRFGIIGYSFICELDNEMKANNPVTCPITNEDFKDAFAALTGTFDLSVYAISGDEEEAVPEFKFTCSVE